MKLTRYCLGLLLLVLACVDDKDVPSTPSENEDLYTGIYNEIYLNQQTSTFRSSELTMRIQTSSGDIIERNATHQRQDGQSLFLLNTGLKTGSYRLLELIYKNDDPEATDQLKTLVYGLGCTIDITEAGIRVTSSYSTKMGLSGSGTADDPYVISSGDHLSKLRSITNDEYLNRALLTPSTYFRQYSDINMYNSSVYCSLKEGWLPIGNQTTTAFPSIYNGAGHKIVDLWINRPTIAGTGLFGYIAGATIDSVIISRADVTGIYGTAALVGAVTTAGNKRQASHILNSRVENSTINGASGGLATAALVGTVDQNTPLSMIRCTTDGQSKVNGSYGVGGLVGLSAVFSQTLITDSHNEAAVSAEYSGAGGIVGSADTLYITSCSNKAIIKGGCNYQSGDASNAAIGAGGIVGGSGISFLTSCRNSGNVSGHEGVGGLIGSTRIKGSEQEAAVYNNTLLQGCSNTAQSVTGYQFVGGLCGEAQFGCFGVYNTSSVKSAESYAGGIVGTSSISVVHNALNTGSVEAKSYSSGIIGKTSFGSIALNRNFGAVTGNGKYVAGIVGLSGNNTMIHYCSNYGYIKNNKDDITAGIVGEVGDPREWSGWDIAECVIGSVELALSVAGPVLALSGAAVEAAGEVSHGIEMILEIAEIGEKVVDAVLIPVDIAAYRSSWSEYFTAEEQEELMLTIRNQTTMEMSAITSEMEQLQSNAISGITISSSFDDPLMGKTIIDNTNSIAKRCEQDKEIGNEFHLAINEKREERYENIESSKKAEELTHNILSGICICLSAIAIGAGIVASVASAGASVAVSIAAAGAIVAVVGGSNSISKSVDNFTENAVVISQCVNMGTIDVAGNNIRHAGGIVGHLQQSCQVKDCLNTGKMANDNNQTGAICGEADSNTDFTRCLNIGTGWKSSTYCLYNQTTQLHSKDLYYVYPENIDPNIGYDLGTKLSPLQACNVSSYKNWAIGTEESALWTIPESEKAYPIPFQTEMLIEE